mmetsp:Transcript_36098/g.85624  ORF Transcript_36098/g.85624 Transcript_36098/m.85624 type:complete len:239 (-) Transcript_36098:577-1293(-)
MPVLRRESHLFVHDALHHVLGAEILQVAPERKPPRQQLVSQHARAPKVGGGRVAAQEHLRRKVGGGPHPLGDDRSRRNLLAAAHVDGLQAQPVRCRVPAIEADVLAREHEVGWLGVRVADVEHVARVKELEHIHHRKGGLFLCEPPPLGVQKVLQCSALAHIHHHEKLVAVLEHLPEPNSFGARLESREEANLVLQLPKHYMLIEVAFSLLQHLDSSYGFLVLQVFGKVDHAIASFTE